MPNEQLPWRSPKDGTVSSDNTYRRLVTEMKGGVGWRDLSGDNLRRTPGRDVEITDVDCVVVEGNFPWNLIRVETDAGVAGIGEAFPGPARGFVEFLRPSLVGENPYDIDRLVEHATQIVSGLGGTTGYAQAAISGIEIALLDIVGKLTELPVYQLLGGKYRDAVRIYADAHAGEALSEAPGGDPEAVYDPAAYAATAEAVRGEGFTAMKFDLDVPIDDPDTATRRLSRRSIDHKAEVAAAVREAVGPEPLVAFDAHWNYSVETATALARRVAPYDIGWLEDPVPPESVDSHRRVTEATETPVLAGENLVRVEGFVPFLTAGAVDLIAPDPQKCGGLREFQKIATVADAFDTPVAPHNIASPVGTIANVHACVAVPNAFILEWHAREVDWWDDLVTADGPLVADGEVAVPEAPGLGITLNLDAVADNLAPGQELDWEAE